MSNKKGKLTDSAEPCPKQDKLCQVKATIGVRKNEKLWGLGASICRQGDRIYKDGELNALREVGAARLSHCAEQLHNGKA